MHCPRMFFWVKSLIFCNGSPRFSTASITNCETLSSRCSSPPCKQINSTQINYRAWGVLHPITPLHQGSSSSASVPKWAWSFLAPTPCLWSLQDRWSRTVWIWVKRSSLPFIRFRHFDLQNRHSSANWLRFVRVTLMCKGYCFAVWSWSPYRNRTTFQRLPLVHRNTIDPVPYNCLRLY